MPNLGHRIISLLYSWTGHCHGASRGNAKSNSHKNILTTHTKQTTSVKRPRKKYMYVYTERAVLFLSCYTTENMSPLPTMSKYRIVEEA